MGRKPLRPHPGLTVEMPAFRKCSMARIADKEISERNLPQRPLQAAIQGVLMGQNGAKKLSDDEVKPFGNSQKGNGKGWLTWLVASDKYPPIK